MRNRICIIVLFLFGAFYGNSQVWRVELQKHANKSVSEIGVEMEMFFDKIGKTRENKYHKYLRWYDYASNHQNEDGYLFNHSLKNQQLLKRMNEQVKNLSTKDSGNTRHYHGGWASINPDVFWVPGATNMPSMGRVNCLAKPTPSSAIIYAGTATGGVWKTYNNGASWIPLWDGMVQTGVSSIVIDYNNPNHILALTGDGDSKFIPSSGVYHSYDGGNTWSVAYSLSTNSKIFGFKLMQSKTNANEYFFGTSNPSFAMIRFVLFGGNPTVEGPQAAVFDIEYQTNEDDILWAASSEGIFKKDGNNSWQEINHPNLPTSFFTRSAVAMAPSNENVIYFAAANLVSEFYGLYKSSDKGQNWTIMYDTTQTDYMTYQCGYNFSLDVDPNDENKVHIGTKYIAVSSLVNGKMEFSEIQNNIHPDIHNTYHIGGSHYVCTDGGISVKLSGSSTYNGISNGLLCTQFFDLDVYGSKIVGGTQDNGTNMWNIGDIIGYQRLGGDGLDCMVDPTNPNLVFASTQDDKRISTNGGTSYSKMFDAEWNDPILFAVDDPNKVIMHAIDELKVSYNKGGSFPTTFNVFSESLNVRAISQCEADPNVLYIAKGDSLAKTENFNATPTSVTWAKSEIYPTDYLRGLLVHPDSCDVVFRVRGGYADVQIEKSVDGGVEFDDYSEGISQLPVYCIYYDHVNGNGYYIGTELGVYYRNSTMNEWIPFSTYLPRVPVYDLKVNNNFVYAGTYGRGIWRSPGYKTCSISLLLTQANDPNAGASSGNQIHKVSNIILTNRIIQGGSGTDVLYQADNYIDLLEGFHAKRNNLFTARAAGCLE